MAATTTPLSSRGASASIPTGESEVWDVIANLWHPQSNPAGYVSMGIAENALMHSELCDFLNTKTLMDPKAKSLTYNDGPFGSKLVRKLLARFLTEQFHSARPVQPEQLLITNGVSAAIEHCAWALANPGEGILLGRPYYRAFLPDIQLRTDVKVVPVSFGATDPCGPDCVTKYEQALLESNRNGVKVRGLMLCHPHNPLGRCYGIETMIELMKLCQKYQIHFISDEIYALSVWQNTVDRLDTPPTGFESALSIDTSKLIDPSLVHVLWGMSKDLGANGIRFGVTVSQSNPDFLAAARACGIYSSPSSLAENAVMAILSDTIFVQQYIQTNRERLSAAYAHAVAQLLKHGIEHKPGVNAAFFLWVNLGKKYRDQHPEISEEDSNNLTDLTYRMCMRKKAFVVSGDAAGSEEPGWFRLVFTQPPELVEEGIRRIADALS